MRHPTLEQQRRHRIAVAESAIRGHRRRERKRRRWATTLPAAVEAAARELAGDAAIAASGEAWVKAVREHERRA
jgi:hypothetical protein